MEKLKLKTIEFNAGEMLTRKQLKNVLGGTRSPGYYKCCYYPNCATSGFDSHCSFYSSPPDGCTADGLPYPLISCN